MVPALILGAMAIQTIGGIYSARKQAKGINEEADDLLLRDKEMRERSKLNLLQIDTQAQEAMGDQVTASAYGGAAVDTGSPLLNYANTAYKASVAKSNILRETEFASSQTRASASNMRRQARDVKIASYFGAAAGVTRGVYETKTASDAA